MALSINDDFDSDRQNDGVDSVDDKINVDNSEVDVEEGVEAGEDGEIPLRQQQEQQQLLKSYPYQCCMEITLPKIPRQRRFPSPYHQQHCTENSNPWRNMAKELQNILQVDPELTQQTYKVITTRCSNDGTGNNNSKSNSTANDTTIIYGSDDHDDDDDVLVVHFYATQCKGLRVSISSFLEYIQVALKCYQEFT